MTKGVTEELTRNGKTAENGAITRAQGNDPEGSRKGLGGIPADRFKVGSRDQSAGGAPKVEALRNLGMEGVMSMKPFMAVIRFLFFFALGALVAGTYVWFAPDADKAMMHVLIIVAGTLLGQVFIVVFSFFGR